MSKTIRIAGTEVSVERRSFEIYIQGCSRHCDGCHNPETWDFNGGMEFEIDDLLKRVSDKIKPFDKLIESIFISGGDLLCWDVETAKEFTRKARELFPNKNLWLFTGCEGEDLPDWVWNYYDTIKAGAFKKELLQPAGTFPATSNQVIIANPFRVKF